MSCCNHHDEEEQISYYYDDDLSVCSDEEEEEEDLGKPSWECCKQYFDKQTPHPTTNIPPSQPANQVNPKPKPRSAPPKPRSAPPAPSDVCQPDGQGGFTVIGYPGSVCVSIGGRLTPMIPDGELNIGFPEPLGQEPYEDTLTPSRRILDSNTEYEEEVDSWFTKSGPDPVTPPSEPGLPGRQVSPDFSLMTSPSTMTATTAITATDMVNHQTIIAMSPSINTSHAPDDIGWINWTGTQWDGNPIDPASMTKEQMCAFLRPTGSPYIVRGIRELFYQVNPFVDNVNPTPSEIQDWNVEVINHIRRMMGYPDNLKNDPRLYLEARWADERKFSTVWDTPTYPGGTLGSSLGPCNDPNTGNHVDIAGGHCGAGFFPNESDRAKYIEASPYFNDFSKYPELQSYGARRSQAEGIKTVNTDLPWAIKVSSMMSGFICGEGTTGHAGPFLMREYMGVSWHVWHNGSNGTRGRFKWR